MDTSLQVLLELTDIDTKQSNNTFRVFSERPHLAAIDFVIPSSSIDPATGSWRGNVTVNALFLGESDIYVEHIATGERSKNVFNLVIKRPFRIIDIVFTHSVILLVSLLFINFGAALDLKILRGLVSRPIGPAIGLTTQFIMMPLLSYGIGCLVFPDAPELQLGLFFTGISPGGGASNIWTVILDGNIDLSVLMTAIGNFLAFLTMPLWLFTLGHLVFERAKLKVPYESIARFAIVLLVPLIIGLIIQRKLPRVAKFLVRLLKPISTCLIVFIVIFATVTNLYLFELFSWQIAVAGLALPGLGYLLAWITAKLLSQNSADALTIAIETGIQNTGISIFMLKLSLPQPHADLTTVIPVSVAIMTPLPLLGMYIYKRWCTKHKVRYDIPEEQMNATKQET